MAGCLGTREHGPDLAHGALDAPVALLRRGLDGAQARDRAIKLDGKAGPVVLHDRKLGVERVAAGVEGDALRARGLELGEGKRQATESLVERRS